MSDGGVLYDLFTAIPPVNVQGALGQPDIGSTAQATVDGVYQGATGNSDTGKSISQATNAVQQLAQSADAATMIGQVNSEAIVNRAVSKPLYHAVDQTIDATFNIMNLNWAALTTVSVTSAASAIGNLSTPDGGIKEAIVWYSTSALTNITGVYVNVYAINTSTDARTLVYASPNIISSVSTAGWNYYDLPTASYITSAQENSYAVELAITGTGTYTLVGLTASPASNPNCFPKRLGDSRNTSGGVTAPSSYTPAYANAVPWIGLAGSAGVSQVAPQTQEFSTPGTATYTVPSFMKYGDYFDIIPIGAGSGAAGGGSGSGSGPGGWAGTWAPITLRYGIDIPLTTTTFAVTVPAGGAGGTGSLGTSPAASPTTVAITGYGTVTAAGGLSTNYSTSQYWSSTWNGQAAGTETYQGLPYAGGGASTVRNSAGQAPGGGGAGGENASTGGPGAPGAVWIVARPA